MTNFYQHDSLNRLTNVVANGSAAVGYGFDPVGNLQSVRYGNSVTNLYRFDSLNRLTNVVWKLNASTLGDFTYKLGLAGQRTNLSETVNGASRAYAWQHDALYRLTNEMIIGASPTGTVGYGHDLVGNRTNRTSSLSGIADQTLTYNTNDWLATDTCDNNGNTLASSGSTFAYDAENRLTNFNNASVLIAYNGDGVRVQKTVGGVTTYYLLDDQNPSGYVQVLEEWTATGSATNLSRVYNYGLDLISQREASGTVFYLGYDGHGSTRFLTDASATVVNVFAYDAYGTLIASNAAPQTAYLYCGEEWDQDLGSHYLRARYYRPNIGRFWTMDTFEGMESDPLSLHKYLYAADNPVNLRDPSGHLFDPISTLFSTLFNFSTTTRDAARVEAGRKQANAGIGLVALLVTMNIVLTYEAGVFDSSDQMEIIKQQTLRREDRTGSPHAYEKYKCVEFVKDAQAYFRRLGKNSQKITYDSYPGRTVSRYGRMGGNICAAQGFGLFGLGLGDGDNISEDGHHEGVLVDGVAYDNNVPFGVPRKLWEQGYEVAPTDQPGIFINLRQAHDGKYGKLDPAH